MFNKRAGHHWSALFLLKHLPSCAICGVSFLYLCLLPTLYIAHHHTVCCVCEHRLLLEKEGSIIKWFRRVHLEDVFHLRCNCVYEVRFMKVFVLSLCFMHVMARKLLYKAHKIHFLLCFMHVKIAWKLLPNALEIHLLLCFMHVRMPWKFLSNTPEIHPFLFFMHVRIAWKLLPFLCLRYMRMAWKLLPNAREIHSLFYLRHVRIAWEFL